MGALSDEELASRWPRAPTSSPGARTFVAALAAPSARVHVKLDTGMGRLGTRDPDEATRVVAARPATALAG